jgi:selenocysteine lyase/cysteine desulfurase
MQKMHISAFCFSGHKSLYGPQGTGGLCLSAGYLPDALVVGGSGSESFSLSQPVTLPDALEAGTQNSHGIAGLLAGVQYVNETNGKVFADADRHARRFVKELQKERDLTLYGDLDAAVRTPVVALNVRGKDSAQTAAELWEKFKIVVRAGAHCAPLMHKTLGTESTGVVRFSFSHFNTDDEVDFAVKSVLEISKDKR